MCVGAAIHGAMLDECLIPIMTPLADWPPQSASTVSSDTLGQSQRSILKRDLNGVPQTMAVPQVKQHKAQESKEKSRQRNDVIFGNLLCPVKA